MLSIATALPINDPNYESKLNYYIPRIAVFSMIISFLMMVYPFRMRKVHHCFDCGHEFKKAQ